VGHQRHLLRKLILQQRKTIVERGGIMGWFVRKSWSLFWVLAPAYGESPSGAARWRPRAPIPIGSALKAGLRRRESGFSPGLGDDGGSPAPSGTVSPAGQCTCRRATYSFSGMLIGSTLGALACAESRSSLLWMREMPSRPFVGPSVSNALFMTPPAGARSCGLVVPKPKGLYLRRPSSTRFVDPYSTSHVGWLDSVLWPAGLGRSWGGFYAKEPGESRPVSAPRQGERRGAPLDRRRAGGEGGRGISGLLAVLLPAHWSRGGGASRSLMRESARYAQIHRIREQEGKEPRSPQSSPNPLANDQPSQTRGYRSRTGGILPWCQGSLGTGGLDGPTVHLGRGTWVAGRRVGGEGAGPGPPGRANPPRCAAEKARFPPSGSALPPLGRRSPSPRVPSRSTTS